MVTEPVEAPEPQPEPQADPQPEPAPSSPWEEVGSLEPLPYGIAETPEPRDSSDAPEEPTPVAEAAPEPSPEDAKRGLRRSVIRTVDRLLAAETDEERKAVFDRASADERNQLQWLYDRVTQRQQARAAPQQDAADAQQWAFLEQMERTAEEDAFTWRENVTRGQWREPYRTYTAWVADLETKGLTPGASVAEVRAFVDQYNRRVAEEAAREAARATDPDATYEDFATRPAWEFLTEAEREALDPANFEGSAVARVRAMERAYGKAEAKAEDRARRAPLVEAAERLNGQVATAQTLAAAQPPKVEGSAPEALDWATVRDNFRAKTESGTATPADYEQFARARAARFGG